MSLSNIGLASRQPLYFYKIFAIIAVELLIAFSSFGYVLIEPVALTLVHIPVLIGALILGPVEGMLFGAVFGLTSMWQAMTIAVTPVDILFSPLASGKPAASVFLSVGCRMVFGFVAGLLFVVAKQQGLYRKRAVLVAAVAATFFHTAIVFLAMYLLFSAQGRVAVTPQLFNMLWNLLFTGVFVYIFYRFNESERVQSFYREISNFVNPMRSRRLTMVYFVGVMTLLALSLFYHVYGRIELALLQEGIAIQGHLAGKLSQIGLQFVVAVIALSCLMALLLLFFEQYSKSMAVKSEWDAMTETYNKGAMLKYARIKLARRKPGSKVAYMMLDVDDFKRINDTYGHPFGDEVLKEVALILKKHFGKRDIVGRLGGDEFCVMAFSEYEDERIAEMAEHICVSVNRIGRFEPPEGTCFSCSIGIVTTQEATSYEQLYQKADYALYETKAKGKNGYTVYNG